MCTHDVFDEGSAKVEQNSFRLQAMVTMYMRLLWNVQSSAGE